ncbi:MAG: tRNA lysidine(34) synthetase TilS [Candidatus Dependentiae bacterium]|nr:tRNA lysidine(34) synthetase TilS [Candidatus Dependentiae bacterium]
MSNTAFIAGIKASIKKHALMPMHSRIIVGLSGGPDSVFLLHMLASMQQEDSIHIIAAHLDHEWRPESGQEALFCAQLCADLNIPFITKKIAELNATITHNGSKEEYARRMRRHFFEQIKKNESADCIALAHHAQDQQETFFIRLIRGATATGLSAIHPKNGSYIHPLLETNKASILTYLHDHGITYLTDPTNESLDFLRNRIRHLVLPALHTSDTRFAANFTRTISHLQETEQFLEQLTNTVFAELTHLSNEKLMLNINLFCNQKPFMRYRILMRWLIAQQVPFTPTHAFLQEIERFLAHPGEKKHQIHHSWHITKKQTRACIEKTNLP